MENLPRKDQIPLLDQEDYEQDIEKIKKLDPPIEAELQKTFTKTKTRENDETQHPSIYVRFHQNDIIEEYFEQATQAFFLEVGYDCIFMRGTNFQSEEERIALKEATQNIKPITRIFQVLQLRPLVGKTLEYNRE